MIDHRVAAAVQPYLQPGERVLWTGRPAAGLRLGPRDAFLVPFSIFWLGFVAFWEWSVLRGSGSPIMLLFGAVMLVFGLFFLIGRFFVDAAVRGGTVYAVTDRRALIVRRFFGERLLSAPLGGQLRLKGRNGDRGTLEFGPQMDILETFRGRRPSAQFALWVPNLSDEVRFDRVADVMGAYRAAGAVA